MSPRLDVAWVSLAFLVLTCHGSIASAQSLGDVARREAERRKQVTSSRVYTNGDLVVVDPAQAPPAPDVPATATATTSDEGTPAPAKAEEVAPDAAARTIPKAREKRDEEYWRARARDLRGRLARGNADIAGTEARLSEMDAGPQTAAIAREREVMAKALARLRSDARFLREEVTRFEALARANNVPADWIR